MRPDNVYAPTPAAARPRAGAPTIPQQRRRTRHTGDHSSPHVRPHLAPLFSSDLPHHPNPSSGDMDGGGGAPAKAGRANNLPFREDCWTEEETATLIGAWGERYVDLNRGNLRQKHWEEVADVVNGRHAAAGKRPRRTDIQCKNRIDTIKKKFKLEKSRLASSPPGAASKWLFFDRVATLVGPAAASASVSTGPVKKKPPPPPVAVPLPFRKQAGEAPPLAQAVVVKKRPSPAVENSYPRRGFGDFNGGYGGSPAMDVDVDVESDSSRSSSDSEEAAEEEEEGNGFRQLARAIARFAEIYERVEEAKQKQVFELEKQRMEFAKGLEYQRMQLFVDSQVNLEKMKRARRSSGTTDNFL